MEKLTIQEVKARLQGDLVDESFVESLRQDPRAGVQKCLKQYENRIQREYDELQKYMTMSLYENELRYQGTEMIAGIDEVGRGPLAGPVVAAAVILPADCWLFGLDDSKKLSETRRLHFYDEIVKHALGIGIGVCSSEEIDRYNIYRATQMAMERAVAQLELQPQHLLLDAMSLPGSSVPQTPIIKGDSRSVSIAAASVIAKVTRDRYMQELAKDYPQYGFAQHVGYGTKQHLEALAAHGITREHRKSFEPVKSQYA